MNKQHCNIDSLSDFFTNFLNHLWTLSVPHNPNKMMKKDLRDFGPDSCSSSEEDEPVEEIKVITKNPKKQRNSVSAESYGIFNKRENFKARIIPKSEETKQQITKRISESFMFNSLDHKDKDIIVNAMEEIKFKKGDNVIKQGEEGSYLYVIEEGLLDCHKQYQSQIEPTYLKTYTPGESFGELALLYNAPRAASITSKTASLLWALDRETFNHIVKDAAMKKRQKYEEFLTKLPLLKQISDPYEKTKIADSIEARSFVAGDKVLAAGSKKGDIYFVEQGEIQVSKNGTIINTLRGGDYFGEIPLLTNQVQPFSFSVSSATASILIVGEGNYKNTLIIVEKTLKDNLSKYAGHI